MFCCRDMFGQSSKSVPKSVFSPARGAKCPGSSDQIFRIIVISECASLVEIRRVTSEIRRRKKERKKEEITTVKYKPFGIAMPCRLIMLADRLGCSNFDFSGCAAWCVCVTVDGDCDATVSESEVMDVFERCGGGYVQYVQLVTRWSNAKNWVLDQYISLLGRA